MDQERNNFQSTKHVKSEVEVEEERDFYPDAESVKNHEICVTIIPFNLKRNVFSDLISAFPHKSISINFYVMVMYYYDRNAILAETIKNRRAETIHNAFLMLHKVLQARGIDPNIYIMDNKCSSELKEAMKSMR